MLFLRREKRPGFLSLIATPTGVLRGSAGARDGPRPGNPIRLPRRRQGTRAPKADDEPPRAPAHSRMGALDRRPGTGEVAGRGLCDDPPVECELPSIDP